MTEWTPRFNLYERIRAYFDSGFAARTTEMRFVQDFPRTSIANYLSATQRRTDTGGWSTQPWGGDQQRTLTPGKRRSMVKRARQIDEQNMLGSSLLDRAVDNIIGTGMVLQSKSKSKRWRSNVEAAWRDYIPQMDARSLMDGDELQRSWYRSHLRDGDVGLLLLRSGAVQTIESDYIQSPGGAGDLYRKESEPQILDGVEVNGIGRPTGFHIASINARKAQEWTRIGARDFVWYPRLERNNPQVVRGVPLVAQLAPFLDQIDGTVEAVVMAHRMSAMFGLIHKRENPAAAFNNLPSMRASANGTQQKSITLEPGMVEYIGANDGIEQVRPEHPTTSFADFMSFLIRLAGLKLGLPLELALLDFSRTNYSSARASMEQAYRKFRIEQRTFSNKVMSRIYRWRISKMVNEGVLSNPPSDYLEHQWFAPEWPYLDPLKDAEGALVAVDAGFSTLAKELARRGMDLETWIEDRKSELASLEEAGLPTIRSNKTREAGAPGGSQPNQPTPNGDEPTEDDNDDSQD